MIKRQALRVLLVAEESAGLQTLKMLREGPHELAGVLASPDHESKMTTVWHAAKKADVPVWPAQSVRDDDFALKVDELAVDVLLNVHSLYLIRGSILEACRMGAYNLHPGPLPHYAGLNVPSWAIYSGEALHAVTLHEMTPDIDAGTIAYESWFPIEDRDNGFTLMAKCIRAGLPLVQQLLDAAAQERASGIPSVPRIAQDFSKRRYFGRQAPNSGQMNWNQPARTVLNHVRASDYSPFASPWGAPRTIRQGDDFGVIKTAATGQDVDDVAPGFVGAKTSHGILVACQDQWVEVRKLKTEQGVVDARTVLSSGDQLQESPAATVHSR